MKNKNIWQQYKERDTLQAVFTDSTDAAVHQNALLRVREQVSQSYHSGIWKDARKAKSAFLDRDRSRRSSSRLEER